MARRSQSAALVQPHSLWLRCLAAFCALLVFGAGVAQAAHIHGEWLPDSGKHIGALSHASQAESGEEHCQLCQAMHSALPVANNALAITLPLLHANLPSRLDELPEIYWQFVMFSRPPPAVIG